MKLIVLLWAVVFPSFSLFASISGSDHSFQKSVMDAFSDRGIVLVVGTSHSMEYWKSISKSKEAFLSKIQGKVNIVFEGGEKVVKKGSALFIPHGYFVSPDLKELNDYLDKEKSGEVIREKFRFAAPAITSVSGPVNYDPSPITHPRTNIKLYMVFNPLKEQLRLNDPLELIHSRFDIVFTNHSKGIVINGYTWKNVTAFLPGEFKDFRFFVTKIHKGNIPVDPQLVEIRIEDVGRSDFSDTSQDR